MMIGALALAVGLSAWAAFQGDGDEVEVEAVRHDAGARSAKSGAGSSSASTGRKTQGEARATKASATLNPADVQALTQGVPQWQSRVNLAASALGASSPWASQRPPPPPPPPPVVEAEPPPPMAPPFPHAWAGRFDDKAVIAGASSTWVVGKGEVIDGQWRIDQVAERQLTLTYLPLNQSQTVAMKSP
jgi:hypothetical protein